MFGNGKKKKIRRRNSCITKLLATKSTRVVEKQQNCATQLKINF